MASNENKVPASFIRIPIVFLLKKQAQIAIETFQKSSTTPELQIRRFYNTSSENYQEMASGSNSLPKVNSSSENDQQMAPGSESIPKVFQKGGLLHWFPYQDMLDFFHDMIDFFSKRSILSLIVMGGAILIGLILFEITLN